MKIIVALDSFKGTLTAVEACRIVSDAIGKKTKATIVLKPMADGGEGTAQTMMSAKGGEWIRQEVMGPLPQMQVDAGFAWFENEKMALVEMASASGLELLSEDQKKPLETTTLGTGQLINAAVEYGAQKILLAVGGSATVDGGVGAAMALGWQFLDNNGKSIPLGGAGLARISKIIRANSLSLPEIEVLCDVNNPLCGEYGAVRIYGPQKGATPEMVEQLENGMKNLTKIVKKKLNCDIDIPGAGAAGGLAASAIAFMNAKLVSGIDTIIKESSLEREMENADWVITGEGCFDSQSLHGKVISGITQLAYKKKVKVAVLAGNIKLKKKEYNKKGITEAIAAKTTDITLEYAMANSEKLLTNSASKLVDRLF